jgi:hypothetical protein
MFGEGNGRQTAHEWLSSWMKNEIFAMKTKRDLFQICLLSAVLLMLPVTARAQFNYVTNDGTITIASYTGSGGAVTIPGTINSLPVTSIGSSAFANSYGVTSVTIPNGVTSIARWAFENCTSLTNVTIPDSATDIGVQAFEYCISLTSVAIPNSVTSIGESAFSSCASLNSVTIPNSVTNIGINAFAACTGLTNVMIGSGVTNLGGGPFMLCFNLAVITVDVLNPVYSSMDGVVFNKSQTTLFQCPMGKAGSYTIPNSVTNIGLAAFFKCGKLTSVAIPNSTTRIGDYALENCTSLTGVYFLGNAPNVGLDVFRNDQYAIVYYLPGTTGWGPTFGGRPTVLWNPQIKTSGATFGMRTNRFGFTITGTTNVPIMVVASTNLAGGTWVPLQNCTLTNGSVYFSDPEWTNYPGRFYRLRSP